MCFSPILIKNPKFFSSHTDFHFSCDKTDILVPCGHCAECRSKKNQEYITRCYYEFLYTKKQNGFVYFDTLTYNESNVPTMYGLKMFNSNDIVLFMKRLRTRLTRLGFNVKDNLKYMLTCEYGGKTYRPHYHVLFFVTFPIDIALFNTLVNKCWSLGLTDNRLPHMKEVHDDCAIRYVCKYVCKDMDLLDVINNQKGAEIFRKNFITLYNLTLPTRFDETKKITYSDIIKVIGETDLLRFLPFHRQSNGLGKYILEMFSIEDLLHGRITLPQVNDPSKVVPLPSYIIRKVFYDYDKSTKIYVINDLGREYKLNQFIQQSTISLNNLECTLSNWSQKYPAQVVQDIITNVSQTCGTKFSCPSQIDEHIKKLLNGRTLSHFNSYMLFYKDRSADISNYLTDDIELITQMYESTLYSPFTSAVHDFDPAHTTGKKPTLCALQTYYKEHAKTFNRLQTFTDYDKIAKIIDSINKTINVYRQNYFDRKESIISQNKKAIQLLTSN